MKIIIDQDILLAEDTRLVKRLYKVAREPSFPDGLKFAYVYRVFRNGAWIDLCRVDNYKHKNGRMGPHVHAFGRTRVEFHLVTFEEAEEYIIELGNRLRTRV